MHRLLTWEVIPPGVSKKRYALTLDPGGATAMHVGVVGHDDVGRWHWRAHAAGGTAEGGAADERDAKAQVCAWLHGHPPAGLFAGMLPQLLAELVGMAGDALVDRRCQVVRVEVPGRRPAYVWPCTVAGRRRGAPLGERHRAWVMTDQAARALLAELEEGRGKSGFVYFLEAADALEAGRLQRIDALEQERRDLAAQIEAAMQRIVQIDGELATLATG